MPLEALEGPGLQVDFASKFESPQSRMPIYFGTVSPSAGEGETSAILAIRLGEKFQAIRIADERLSSPQWMYAGAGPGLGELWGVLDDGSDPPAADLLLVHSTDGGMTWHIDALHKPTEQADFTEFQMDRAGHGRVSLYVSSDQADDDAPVEKKRRGNRRRAPRRPPVRAGYYHFRTSDDGKTWLLTTEPDAMTPAGDVPDEEQPVTHSLVMHRR